MTVRFAVSLILLICVNGLVACSATKPNTKPSKPSAEPQASSVRLKQQQVTPTGQLQDQVVEKPLFAIVVSPKRILVNGVELPNPAALNAFLEKQSSPVLTLTAHRCLSPQATSEILSIVQAHTDSPIPFGTRGDLTDPDCE